LRREPELPERDEVIESLDVETRERIGREWARRAEVELTAATLSAQLVRDLLLAHAVPNVLELAAQAVVDEVHHARLCHAVAERYLDRALPAPRSRRIDEPQFGTTGRELSRLLCLVLHCCVNETLATVCLREGLKAARSPTAHAVTRRLLADDLNHARLGWAHLASPVIGDEARHHLARALPTLLRLGVEGWRDEPRADFDAPAHGVLGNERFPRLMQEAVTDLILPGFDYVGIDTAPARTWWTANNPSAMASASPVADR
jgi:hypothetical protein